jgi:cytochrome oxidase assembly protein ShyY1
VPEPPGGTVEVRGVAGTTRDLQPQDEVDVRAGAVVLPRVDVGHLADAWRLPLVETWVTAQWQEPPPTGSQPRLPDPPSGSDVNHLSYAIQWFTLAAIPIVGWPILLWRVRRRDGRRRAPASHVHEQER